MLENNFINSIKEKYNYDDKTLRALNKVVPRLIEYYGKENEFLILEAILNCEIIPCNSYQTISKIEKEKKLTPMLGGETPLGNIDLKKSESAYLSNVEISYDEMTNTFNIDDISRTIVTAHTFNYDSPKGLEVLTYALCKLVKSYQDEYVIEENTLIKKSGIETEKYQIIKEKDKIYMTIIENKRKGLEEGFNIYDTEQIVSMVLNDKYKCHDYYSIYTIAYILKEKFKLLDKINNCELSGNIEEFKKICSKEVDSLSTKCDECLNLEHEMFISMIREDKDELANVINSKLKTDVFSIMMRIYENNPYVSVKS